MTIKVGFYSHTIDFAGTWRSHERLIQVLEQDPTFETYVLYCTSIQNDRLNISQQQLTNTTFVPFSRSLNKTGPEKGYAPFDTDFKQVCQKLNLDILHFARSGYYEWPFNERHAKLQVETNIFGADDNSPFLDRSISISNLVNQIKKKKSDVVISNPIPLPSENYSEIKDLRSDYGIEETDIVLGRIGRPANFNPIALTSYANVKSEIQNLKYLIIGGCNDAKSFVSNNKIKDVIFIPPTNDDNFIEKFHKTINVFAHYRSDGETHGTAIAQAMMYGIPVISHYGVYNAHVQTIGNGGICAKTEQEYTQALFSFCLSEAKRKKIGQIAKQTVVAMSEQNMVGNLVANCYKNWLGR